MNPRILLSTQLVCGLALLIAGCSGKGPDLVDPETNQRAQTVLLAVDKGGSGELDHYSELTGAITPNSYAAANNGESLGKPIDAIYENNNHLYLHHRDAGEISVLDLRTQKKLSTLSGFPGGVEGQMTSMAFSNISQAWVVCYNSPNLYHVDQDSLVIADTFALDGNPTNVGTNGRYVFVSTEQPDGTAKVHIFQSNFVTFGFEKTLTLPSPVIYSAPSSDNFEFVIVTAGGVGETKPKVHFIRMDALEMSDEIELDSDPLTAYIGKEPNFAAYTRDDFLYLALPSMVGQVDVRGRYMNEWYSGSYPVLGVDYASGLFYAYSPGSMVVKRKSVAGEELPDLNVPSDVRSIFFLGTNRVVK
jgi:hypothetical protein